MITPCDCKGSMGHVHEACLVEWIRRKSSDSRLNKPSCPHCFATYKIKDMDGDDASALDDASTLSKVRELYKLAVSTADEEDRAAMFAGYSQRVLVLLPLLGVVALGFLLLLRVWLELFVAGPSPEISKEAAAAHWAGSGPVSVASKLLFKPLGQLWAGSPSLATGEAAQPGLGVSTAWSYVFLALQRAAEARFLFSFVFALVLGEVLPEKRVSNDLRSRVQELWSAQAIPFGILVVRGILVRASIWGLFAGLSLATSSVLDFFVWRILASYFMVALDLFSVTAAVLRLHADLVETISEDISTLRSSDNLQAGRLCFQASSEEPTKPDAEGKPIED